MKYNIIIRTSVLASLVFIGSCTKLDETKYLYDTVNSDGFYQTDAELSSAVGAAYSNLSGIASNNHFIPINEAMTDECVVPTRGPDWGDGGRWVRLATHTVQSTDTDPINGWNFCYSGVNTCNRLIATLSKYQNPKIPQYVAELRGLRAIYYLWLLDWYGNVPISIDFSQTTPPANSTRDQVYALVESELRAVASILPHTGPAAESTYGRVNAYTCWAALAKLYLNAQIYTGTAQWDKCMAACDTLINSGLYTLTPNYADNFSKENKGVPETIFTIPYDHVHEQGNNFCMMTLNGLNQNTYNMNAQPWNGFASIQEFYNSYIDPSQNPGPQGMVVGTDPAGDSVTGTLDKRLSNFLVGPQYGADGKQLQDGGYEKSGPNYAGDPNGAPIVFTPYINELQPTAWRQSGARIAKWAFYSGMTQNQDNDFAIFRYADILLTKAEANARKAANWNDPITLAIVNQIRTVHGGVDPFASMTAASFLAERGREMFFEGWRRQDQIRFGVFNNAWRFHPADPADNLGPHGINHVNILPLPDAQLNANKNLKQNPGY
ncbi:RagB/SusD family nutrient uptake outer membrane protein [Puia sp. P3]|uniref:RagB/SusD family nutrient uptake outer membrane protein n=1 Tax=Puia sp. P3 TaxID=3423952 RepID=UPI003D66542D